MRIKLGLGLDGMKPKKFCSAIGEKEVGPIGFLTLLETQYGIAPISDSTTTRIIQYLAVLKKLDNPKCFYHDSFSIDEFNVAKTLLAWRDTLYEAGWDGIFYGDFSSRLQEMANIEQHANDTVSDGFGQRLQTVLSKLKDQKTQIDEVYLLDPFASFPPLWRTILKHNFTLINETALIPSAQIDSDLKILQGCLNKLSNGTLAKDLDGTIKKTTLNGDHSFIVVKAKSKAVSARLIAQWMTHPDTQNKLTAVLATQSGIEIDEALAAVDLPRLGFDNTSPWRPVLQVLPITLDLLWAPLNPEILLQFLMHPVGPLVARIRKPLANIVAQSPGIGGEQWQAKLTELLEKEQTRENFSKKDFKKLKEDIEYWFSSERYDPHIGMPLEVAKERCLKVANWLAQQQAKHQDDAMRSLFGAAYSQASELNIALTHLVEGGTETIKPEQLRYLLDQLTGAGTGIVDKFSECLANQSKHLVGAQHADSFYQAVDSVVWWDLQAQANHDSYPWSCKEMQQLEDWRLFSLPNLDEQLEYKAKSWLKPINAAKERFILVIHDSKEAHHPLWDQINSCVENWHEINAEDEVLAAKAIASLNDLSSVKTPYKPLPSLSRWWKLETGKQLTKRDKESYSSLENFFYSPYQWVLHYKAELTAGTLQSLSDGNLLKGTLVHHLYEKFFNENAQLLTETGLDTQKINEWFDIKMKQLLVEEGAVLLMRGRLVEKEMFISTARQSLHQLIHQLRVANIVQVEMEAEQEALFLGGHLQGLIDMKVTNKEGEEAVVDIKWGGLKYRKESLRENKHLQLVTYSYLSQQNSKPKKWPPVAFFIIEEGVMVAQDKHYFPEAIDVSPIENENHAVIWQKMEKTWKWRRQQIDQGLIEVTVTGTKSDKNSDAGEDALIIPEKSDRFNDYRVLTGWGE